jgi:proteic killer suppression protein
LDAVCHPDEYRYHDLKGDRDGQYAVTIRGNWRIVFEWDGEHAVRVRQEDYDGD